MSFQITKDVVEEAVRRADVELGQEVFFQSDMSNLAVRGTIRGYTRFIVNLDCVLEEVGMTGSDYMWQLADVTERVAVENEDDDAIFYFPGITVVE